MNILIENDEKFVKNDFFMKNNEKKFIENDETFVKKVQNRR